MPRCRESATVSSSASSERMRTTLQLLVGLRPFLDLDHFVHRDIEKFLRWAGISGPSYLQAHDPRRASQPNVLLQGRRTERASAADGAVDAVLRAACVLHGHLDTRADRGTVCLDTDQPDADPIVAMTG